MHRLDDKAIIVIFHCQNTLGAKNVDTEALGDIANPAQKSVGVEGAIAYQRKACHIVVMIVLVERIEKLRFDFQNAVKVESALVENFREIYATALDL